MWLRVWLSAWLAGRLAQAQFNNPPGVDIWCGKAYRASNDSFNPGGSFADPPYSAAPLLQLLAKPRMSIYLESDRTGSVVVDAAVSHQVGEPLAAALASSASGRDALVKVTVKLEHSGANMATALIQLGSLDNEISLSLARLPARIEPYGLVVEATLLANGAVYSATTDLYRLPVPDDERTVARIDNLYGGLWYQRHGQDWQSIFPYTYYVQWSLYWDSNVSTLDEFAAMGYNLIHIVPTGSLGDSPFPWTQFQPYLDRARDLGLLLQYDVIWTPTNDSAMREQVARLRSHPAILLWYQSDEPDGKSNPLNATGLARDAMWQLDPYHPSSLALNCYDFYYADYARGGEILISDVYPISTNTSWSTVYETPCNATYGCCGCDDCTGAFEDISGRLDEWRRRDRLLAWPKTQWAAPQAFGNESFWTRFPSAAEEAVMALLAVNHGAKGLVAWDFPTTAELSNLTEQLAAVLTTPAVAAFLLESPRTPQLAVEGARRVDAAVWVRGREALLVVVHLNYGNTREAVEVTLPDDVTVAGIQQSLWGHVQWTVSGKNTLSSASGLLGLQVSMVVLKLA